MKQGGGVFTVANRKKKPDRKKKLLEEPPWQSPPEMVVVGDGRTATASSVMGEGRSLLPGPSLPRVRTALPERECGLQ